MKKIISIILSVLMIFSSLTAIYADESENNIEYDTIKTFPGNISSIPEPEQTDITAASVPCSDWAAEDIEKARALEIISGNYNFPAAITREGFCEIIYSYITNVLGMEINPLENMKVTDCENHAVNCLVGQGIIEGKSVVEISPTPLEGKEPAANIYDITFAPNDLLTREEAATILLRLVNKTIPVTHTEIHFDFDDIREISDWAHSAVQVMCNMGVMKGVGENRFAPKDIYTTEQAIVTAVRVYAAQSAHKNILGAGTPAAYTHEFNYKLSQLMPDDKNYMISPLSLKMAFAMVANGAEGNTQKELLDALGIQDLAEFNKNSKELMAAYNTADVLKLNIANSLWINQDRMKEHFTNEFEALAKEYYSAEVETVDNKTAVPTVNAWADKQTFGKIPTVISNPEFELLLANALYFKGTWQNEFPKHLTQKDIFTSRDGKETEIDFMRQTDYFHYYDHGGKAVIALPYKNRQPKIAEDGSYLGMDESTADISMYLIQGEYDMHTDILKGFARNKDKEKTYVTLKMPKFEFEFKTGLNDIMNSLGAKDAFTEGKANLNPMVENGGNKYYIKDSLQKTYIKVDEEGTEAAAVTIAAGGAASMPQRPEPIEITFDKPFTFVIYDNANNEVLFMGEYAFAN